MKRVGVKDDVAEQIVTFISEFIEREGYSPTVREVRDALDVTSTDTVYEYLLTLRRRKLVEWRDGTPRTLRVTK